MNIAIGIGTLLLGGWVLNAPPVVEEEMIDEQATQESTETAPGPLVSPSRMPGYAPGRAPGSATGGQPRHREISPDELNQPRRRTQPNQQQQIQQQQQQQQQQSQQPRSGMLMPVNPTESSENMGTTSMGLPAPPTATDGPAVGMPVAPTFRRPTRQQTSGGLLGGGGQQQQLDRSPAMAPREKAFSQARPMSSGVSPYMNLYRNDTAGGTIDNYTTIVRPAFEQQSRNQQLSNDIFGLERSSRIQNSQLQQLSRGIPRSLQGVATPQYYMQSGMGGNLPPNYMNYGNYYQGGQGYGP